MSDFAWIALIIIVYLVVIRPMFQGIVQKPGADKKQTNSTKPRPNNSNQASQKKDDSDYVDYEEVK